MPTEAVKVLSSLMQKRTISILALLIAQVGGAVFCGTILSSDFIALDNFVNNRGCSLTSVVDLDFLNRPLQQCIWQHLLCVRKSRKHLSNYCSNLLSLC